MNIVRRWWAQKAIIIYLPFEVEDNIKSLFKTDLDQRTGSTVFMEWIGPQKKKEHNIFQKFPALGE